MQEQLTTICNFDDNTLWHKLEIILYLLDIWLTYFDEYLVVDLVEMQKFPNIRNEFLAYYGI